MSTQAAASKKLKLKTDELSDKEKLRFKITDELSNQFGEAIREYSAEEIEALVDAIQSRVDSGVVTSKLREDIVSDLQLNPSSGRWLAGKALDVILVAASAFTGVYLADKYFGRSQPHAEAQLMRTDSPHDSPYSNVQGIFDNHAA
jgi:hypothetical protein